MSLVVCDIKNRDVGNPLAVGRAVVKNCRAVIPEIMAFALSQLFRARITAKIRGRAVATPS